jgi:hypothetical protein
LMFSKFGSSVCFPLSERLCLNSAFSFIDKEQKASFQKFSIR